MKRIKKSFLKSISYPALLQLYGMIFLLWIILGAYVMDDLVTW